ncbi:MAG: DUF4292 domain-containing protein [Saprospiraceae bacterium]
MRKSIFFWITIIVVLLNSGCKTKKKFSHVGPLPERSKTELLKALKDHNYDFEWYACKAGISLDTPDEGISGTTYIRLKKDSIIWSVIKKLSVEIARTLVTENTYVGLNRVNGTYQKGQTDHIINQLGISLGFQDLQQALCGNIILPDTASTSIKTINDHYIIASTFDDLEIDYWVNGYSMLLDKMIVYDYLGKETIFEYDDYRLIDNKIKMAHRRHISTPYLKDGKAEITLKMKKIELDVAKKTKFSIPSHYERIY